MTWTEDLRFFSKQDPIDLLLQTLDEMQLTKGTVGCELGERTRLDCSWNDFEVLRTGLPNAELIDAAPLIWELRTVKSPAEIEYLQKACDISQSYQPQTKFLGAGNMACCRSPSRMPWLQTIYLNLKSVYNLLLSDLY